MHLLDILRNKNLALTLLCVLVLASCTSKYDVAIKTTEEKVLAVPPLVKLEQPDMRYIIASDDRNDSAVLASLDKSIAYYQKINQATIFDFSDRNLSAKQMSKGLIKFREIFTKRQSFDDFLVELKANFDVYQSKNYKNKALITGYYAPIIKASLVKTEQFTIPVYGAPKHRIIGIDENGTKRPMKKSKEACFTHEEIANGALGNETPLFWVENPAERFFLAIQGSGIIVLPDSRHLNVGYAGGNGHPYYSIGKYFGENKLLPSEQISTQSIKRYLASLPHDEAQSILNANPNFVFFKIQDKKGVFGNISVALTPFASVAMDSKLMPKGALAFVKTQVPYKTDANQTSVPKTQRTPWSGFVLIQDTGGAITGGGRVDLYCGEGDDAYFYAGQMAESGEVYLFAPK